MIIGLVNATTREVPRDRTRGGHRESLLAAGSLGVPLVGPAACWLAHRLKNQKDRRCSVRQSGCACHARLCSGRSQRPAGGRSKASGTATGCWLRLTTAPCGRGPAASLHRQYPQLRAFAEDTADHHVVLDGRAVSGVPSFSQIQNQGPRHPCQFWAFDLLCDGRALLGTRCRPA